MRKLGPGLKAFLHGEMDLEGLLAVIDHVLIEDSGSVPAFQQHVRSLHDAGRVSAKALSAIEHRIASHLRQPGTQSPSTSSQVVADMRPVLPEAPTVITTARGSRGSSSGDRVTGGSRGWSGHGGALPRADSHTVDTRSGAEASNASAQHPSGGANRTGGGSRSLSHPGSSWSGSGADGFLSNPTEYPAEAGEPDVGQVLNDRFELVALLGRGGMSVVFKAMDRRKAEALDRDPYVALKLLNTKFKRHPESLKTLQREARKAQGLKHPNVISIYDFDKDENGNYFIAMEMLSGEPLDQFIRDRRKQRGMAPRDAYRLIEQMGGALAVAHKQKPPIVHSDFKPSNVFLAEAGEVKVFDFGIARAARPAEGDVGEATNFDAGVLGALTPNYASPEMLAGLDPDPRDDIYALAIVAYELLSGRRPFGKRSAMEAISKGIRPRRIKSLTWRQWKGLERALAFKRDKRTPTVERFLDDLRCRRSMIPWYAAAGIGAIGLGLWFFVVDPMLKQQQGDTLLQEALIAPLDRLPVLVTSAADVPAATRDGIYVRVAGRLLKAVNEGEPDQVVAALETVHDMPQPVLVPIYAGLEELLLERMLGTDRNAATAAVHLAGKLPSTVANYIFSAAGARLVDAFAKAGEQDVSALIETVRMFPAAPRRNIFARSRESILRYFSAVARRFFLPEEGHYDFDGAQAVLAQAVDLYPDSKTLDDAKLAMEKARDEAWGQLSNALERFVLKGLFLPSDDSPDTVPGALARMQQLDPAVFPAMAERVVPLYLEQVRQARTQGDMDEARRYLSTALTFFPGHAQLRRERVAMDLAQEHDYRTQELIDPPVEDPNVERRTRIAALSRGLSNALLAGDLDGAYAKLVELTELAPQDAAVNQGRTRLAESYLGLIRDARLDKRRDDAKNLAETGLTRLPYDPFAKSFRGELAGIRDDRDQEQRRQAKAERDRIERARAEREKAEQERAERLAQEERDSLARERAERERQQEDERQAQEHAAQRRERHDTALQYWKLIQNTYDLAIMQGFIDGFPDDPVLTPLAKKRLRALEAWADIEESDDIAQLEGFLRRHSDDAVLAPIAKRRLETLRSAESVTTEVPGKPRSPSDSDKVQHALARAEELPAHMIQQALKNLGHYVGTVDGQVGPGTHRAVRAFQKAQGHAQSGELSNAERVILIRKAADAGHPESQNILAQMAAEGVGIPKNAAMAVHWFQASADRGNPYAAYNLGVMYREGRGVDRSVDLARRYFRAALVGGHPTAATALKDLPVADAGDAASRAALARVGELPAQLIQQALKDLGFLKGAADGVVGPGTRRAIRAYQGSRGLKQSGTLEDAETVSLIVQAAEAGHAGSQNTLGMMVAAGVGVVKDPQEAFHWFSSAAEKGDAYAAYNLGVIYRDGVGVDRSIPDARKHFKSARFGGHPQAAQALADLDR